MEQLIFILSLLPFVFTWIAAFRYFKKSIKTVLDLVVFIQLSIIGFFVYFVLVIFVFCLFISDQVL
jgi:hypothetical protein